MDFPAQVEIEVTIEDIEQGIPKCGDACAIARAACRAFGSRVEVAHTFLYVIPSACDSVRYILGPASQKFILAFDEGREVQPGKFIAKKT